MKFPTYIHTIGTGWLTMARLKIIPPRSVWTLILVVAACVAISPPASSQVYYGTVYSGASTGSNGTVYGWGVTDVWFTDSYHTARITTWLSSPGWRRYVSGGGSAYNFKRADLSLPFDANDLGQYTASSTHDATCTYMGVIINAAPSVARTTVPYVVLSLVTTGVIPADNVGRTAFNTALGTTSLGTRYYSTQAYWGTGVQVVGTVYPTSFSGPITIHREVREDKLYHGNTLYQQTAPPIYPDTSFPEFRDDNPQSGGSADKVYDLDAPGVGGVPLGTTSRIRTNFRQWAVLNSPALVVSPIDLYWYSRVSIYRDSTGEHLKTDVSGDNVAGVGQTNTTWNLL